MEVINNFIKNNKILSIIIGLIGTVFVGALGNGAWEYLLKPLFSFSIDLILNLSTLGIESFKNNVYLSIAEGFSEKNSIHTFNLLIFSIFTAALISIIINFLEYKNSIKQDEYEAEFERMKDDVEKIEAEIEKIKFNIQELSPKLKNKIYLSIFSVLIGFILTFVLNTKLQYINNSIIYYNQLIRIATPYISEQEVKIFNSRFSLIKNKTDYEGIINNLFIILEKNNLKVEKRNIWWFFIQIHY